MDKTLVNRLRFLGLKIALYRRNARISQEGLSEQSGVSCSYLAKIEANSSERPVMPSLECLYSIADALGIPITKLLEDG